MPQCECATKYEWTSEMVTLEHHPNCNASLFDTLEKRAKIPIETIEIYERAPGEFEFRLIQDGVDLIPAGTGFFRFRDSLAARINPDTGWSDWSPLKASER